MDTNFDEGARISPIQPRLLSSFFRDRENGSLSRAIIKKERVQQPKIEDRKRRSLLSPPVAVYIVFEGALEKCSNHSP